MQQKSNDYYLGLIYCTLNDIENAYFHLNRAAKKGNKIAMNTLKELKEKKLLPPFVTINSRIDRVVI